jgi:hypothetical protein
LPSPSGSLENMKSKCFSSSESTRSEDGSQGRKAPLEAGGAKRRALTATAAEGTPRQPRARVTLGESTRLRAERSRAPGGNPLAPALP